MCTMEAVDSRRQEERFLGLVSEHIEKRSDVRSNRFVTLSEYISSSRYRLEDRSEENNLLVLGIMYFFNL